MKMTKATYNLLLRLVAGVAASLILVGAIAMRDQRAAKNVYRAASGIDPSRVVMTIDGKEVNAEEYLYWLSYYCDYYSQYMSYMDITDWSTELEPGFTAGDYIAQQAELQTLSMVTQYAVIDNWAQEAGITLTEEDVADIDAQRAASIEQLGGEAAYQQWLQSLGISDDFITHSLGNSYLINHLSDAYHEKGSAIYPDEGQLNDYTDSHEYFGALILFIDTCEMDETAKADAFANMNEYAAELGQAADPDAAFAEIAKELGLDTNIATFTADVMEDGFIAGLKEVDIGAVTGVISTEEGCYVAIRKEPATNGILDDMLNEEFAQRCADAEVVYNDEVYGSVNTLTFYRKLLAARGTPLA